ncbi:MAG TPA: cation diffusion facilitator family transporter [Solirubrobacterales bacterium]|nr:cation diffusion facilitator family transporter [Solirubrobacterales bacterium]
MAHSHAHGLSGESDTRRLAGAFALIVGFMVAELVAGILGSSLALISDAGHMLTDAVAIGLALAALRLAHRPPAGSFTYGLQRAEILSAQINGITLLLLGALIVFEGIRRLIDPPEVAGGLVLVVALIGIVVNLVAARILAGAERRSLNIEGAFLHIVTDLFAFVATAIAGALILIWGLDRADGIASLLIAALMLWAAYGLLRESGRVFMEAAPKGLDPQAIGEALIEEDGVVEVHDLHVWEVTTGMPAISAHMIVRQDADCHEARWRAARLLADRFGVEHSTLQVEHEPGDELLQIQEH